MQSKNVDDQIPTWKDRWREPKGNGEGIPERNRMMGEIQDLRELLKFQNIVNDPRFLKFINRLDRISDETVQIRFDARFAADDFEKLVRNKRADIGYATPEPVSQVAEEPLFSTSQIHSAHTQGRNEGIEEALAIVKLFAQDTWGFIEDDNPHLPMIKAIEKRLSTISSSDKLN
jgi:hypothetical protein